MRKSKVDVPPLTSLPRGSAVLSLTNIRSFQQNERVKEIIAARRKERYGKAFKTLSKPPKFCKSYKSVFIKTDENGKPYVANIKALPYKTWACPDCQKIKAIKLRYDLIEIIKANRLDHFLTLTLNPSRVPYSYTSSGNKTGKYITYLFNRYVTTLKRKFRKPIRYVWVKQYQKKNGMAHLHILLSCYLPVRYLRKEWVRIGGGNQMDIQQIQDIEAVAKYVCNYVVKGINNSSEMDTFRVGERRYSVSKSCTVPIFSNNLSTLKVNSINELSSLLSTKQFFDVYNLLQNSEVTDKEIVLAPHQLKIFEK